MGRLLGDEGLRSKLSAAATSRSSNFTAEAVVPHIERTYAAVLQERAA
jgi:hypothetical protein